MASQSQASPRGPVRLRLGIVGFGVQGTRLAAALTAVQGVEVVAVADVYATRLQRAKELLGASVTTVRDYRSLIDGGVDAVLVATPDHLHAPIATQALAAGKDVYVEPPLTHSAAEAAAVVAAAARSSRVCYCGSGRSQSALLAKAKSVIAAGRVGAVSAVSARWDSSGAVDAWQTSFPPDASPESIDFAAFLAGTAPQAFDLKRFFRWRGYWDYGGGLAAERFAPLLTDVYDLLGIAERPSRVAVGGGLHRWKDGRETPDVMTAVLDVDNGPTVTLTATQNGAALPRSIAVVGSEATLMIEDRRLSWQPTVDAEAYGDMANTLPREYRDWYFMMHGMSNQGQLRSVGDLPVAIERYEAPAGAPSSLTTQLSEFVGAVRARDGDPAGLERAAAAAATVDRINIVYRQGNAHR